MNPFYLRFLFIFHGLLILGGLFALAYGLSAHEPLGHRLMVNALFLSAVAAFFYLLMVFRWIRGRSSPHRHYLIILILSLIGFPLALTGGALTTNGVFDTGKETSHRVRISKLYDKQSKNSRTYYVDFPSWREPGTTHSLSIPDNLYRVLRPDSEITIRTRPGYWQEEWIAGLEPSSDPTGRPDAAAGFALTLRSIRFYEGGTAPVPATDKRFAKEFSRDTTRFIYCQVDMVSDYWNLKDQSYTFVWRYIDQKGVVRAEPTRPFTVRKEWQKAWITQSWGWETPGNWPAGTYRVAVFVDGRPFGEGNFAIR